MPVPGRAMAVPILELLGVAIFAESDALPGVITCTAAQTCVEGACVQPACAWKPLGSPTVIYLPMGTPSLAVVADWNEDGRQDVVVGASSGPLYTYLQSGGMLKEAAVQPPGSAYVARRMRGLATSTKTITGILLLESLQAHFGKEVAVQRLYARRRRRSRHHFGIRRLQM